MPKINLGVIGVLFLIGSGLPSDIGVPPDLCHDKYWDETVIVVCSAGNVTYDKKGLKELLKSNGFLDRAFHYTKLLESMDKEQLERLAKKEKWLI